jgi:putative drug exporter of the RND superfamily
MVRERAGRRLLLVAAGLVVVWLAIGSVAGPASGRLSEVQKNDNASFLPGNAEATRVQDLVTRFAARQTIPVLVVYERPGGLTGADRAAAAADVTKVAALAVVVPPVPPPIESADHQALQVVVPFRGEGNGDAAQFGTAIDEVKAIVADGAPAGLSHYLTGPGGLLGDFLKIFSTIDTKLLLVTGIVVIVILLLIYRSPVLWIVPVLSAGLAYTLAGGVVYLLASNGVMKVNGQSQGILTVLVFGAGTDYALLLISRYREELRRHQRRTAAMAAALRGAGPAVFASGSTVILSLLCLLLSELNSNRGLGPVAAIGIGATLLTMLTFLPALLVLCGRWVFWPRVPHHGSPLHETSGVWGRVAAAVGRRSRLIWPVTAVLLLGLVFGLTQLNANGLSQTQAFTNRPESVVGQDVLARHFPAGAGSPAVVIARAAALPAVLPVIRGVPGVDPAGVVVVPGQAAGPGAAPGGAAAPVQPKVVDGLAEVQATLTDPADSKRAYATVRALRAAVHAVPGADALVGGFTAINVDTQDASRRDRNVIIPVVLLVIAVILALLLRALVAPLVLVVTVVLSFAATLGLCGLIFRHVYHFAGADTAFPLFAFVFLVALGVDYNIFLMTRVREESARDGTRPGTLHGLAVTGGVITSAGVVLAATFSVLGVLPMVFLAELGTAVAIGVLLDTIVVRSLLVPSLTYDLDRRVWWPGRLSRAAGPDRAADEQAVARA